MVFQGDDKIAEHARLLCMYVWHENEDSLTLHDDDAMMMMRGFLVLNHLKP